jgi:cysteine-rich repeat protein
MCLAPLEAEAQDGDGDGVPDVRDLCQRTRAGRTVDEAGCHNFCEAVFDAATPSAFLRTGVIELGTADVGSFGTVNAPPAGWHERPDGSPLGFVANPLDDDWTNYVGDFFVPGTPEEGWGLNVGGADFFNSRLMGLQQMAGGFSGVRVECRPRICGLRGGASVYWSGSHNGIDIQQTYSVFNEGAFILIEVELTNTTPTAQTVYYLRNVDPDNMQTVTGSFTTLNTIDSQGDGSATSLALVSATTSAPDSYIALASSDPDARVMYGGFSNRDADGIWNCSTAEIFDLVCTPGSSLASDIGIALSVRKDIPAGETRNFSFVYTLSRDAIAESVACTVPSICGDGRIEGTEQCDDGDMLSDDGCNTACEVEPGWECMSTGGPSVCTEICGDGLEVGDEICDTMGDSATCDANCTTVVCGDEYTNTAAGEQCDDANTRNGDGCSSTCRLETDAGMPDAGPPDAGLPDAGRPDAGPPPRPDAGPEPINYGVSGGAVCAATPGRGGAALGWAAVAMIAGLWLARRRRR